MATWALFLTIITLLENTKSALLKNAHIKFVTSTESIKEKTTIASSSLLINASITILFVLFILLFGGVIDRLFNGGKDLYTIFIWFIPGLLAMVFFSHFEAIQQSHFDFQGAFAGNLVRQISFFCAIAIHFFLKIPINVYLLGLYQSASILLGTVMIFFLSKKYLLLKFTPSRYWSKMITGYGGYIFGTGVISNIYSNLDQFMTAAIVPGSVAFYNAAKRLNGFIDMPTYAAADIAFPKLSAAFSSEGIEKIRNIYERMVSIIFCIIFPVALVAILFAEQIILIIAGEKYLSAVPILKIYMAISVAGVIQHQGATTLYSIGKTRLCFIVSCLSLILNIAVTYICLKLIGFYGAAIGVLITSVFTTSTWVLIMKKEVKFKIANIFYYSKQNYLIATAAVKKAINMLRRKLPSS